MSEISICLQVSIRCIFFNKLIQIWNTTGPPKLLTKEHTFRHGKCAKIETKHVNVKIIVLNTTAAYSDHFVDLCVSDIENLVFIVCTKLVSAYETLLPFLHISAFMLQFCSVVHMVFISVG